MKFRTKTVVEAVQWWPDKAPAKYPDWFWDVFAMHPERFDERSKALLIPTVEGTRTHHVPCFPGDWIIRMANGALYPCKPDIFAATYEPVGETAKIWEEE